jgi:hypothetical protein
MVMPPWLTVTVPNRGPVPVKVGVESGVTAPAAGAAMNAASMPPMVISTELLGPLTSRGVMSSQTTAVKTLLPYGRAVPAQFHAVSK